MICSKKMRQAAYGLLKPLERNGIESVDFIDVESGTVTTTVKKSKLNLFVPIPEAIERLPEIPPRETYVNVVLCGSETETNGNLSKGGTNGRQKLRTTPFLNSY